MITEDASNLKNITTEPEEMAENPFIGTETELESEPNDLNQASNQELQELKDKYLRLLAEFENFKKRTSRERIDFAKYASQDLITSLLTVLDDFEREKKAGQVTEGSKLIHTKLSQLLINKGLKEMTSSGETFDASMHEAITELPVGDDQKNKIIDTVEKGYYLNDKIIRYAKVVVGK